MAKAKQQKSLREVKKELKEFNEMFPNSSLVVGTGENKVYMPVEQIIQTMEDRQEVAERVLFEQKQDWLRNNYLETPCACFYDDLFFKGEYFQEKGLRSVNIYGGDGRGNAIMTVIPNGDAKAYNRILFSDMADLSLTEGEDFTIISPASFFGRRKTKKNAHQLFAIAIDLDGVGMPQLRDLFHQMNNQVIPRATYVVNSGHGLHVYYFFEEPIDLYSFRYKTLNQLKHNLTAKIWNRYTSKFTERDEVQYQSIVQSYRAVGSPTKFGPEYRVTAYQTGERVTLEYLNSFLKAKDEMIDLSSFYKPVYKKSTMTIEEAREKYPEWYDWVVIQKKAAGRWHIKRDLYDWWLRTIREKATAGHRYFCIMALTSYAIKCDIDEDELIRDAYSLIDGFDEMTDDKHNHFTKKDVNAALQMFNESYTTFPRAEIEKISGIPIPPNKRNYRPQEEHLKLARYIRDELNGKKDTWQNKDGRPTMEQIVRDYLIEHPDARKCDIIKETGLSKPTVYKWYNKIKEEEQK